jgi:transcriptional regulator with XRE-family HTH domain
MKKAKQSFDDLPVNTLGERISYCRKNANLSQKQLAEATGVTQGAVFHWELRDAQPRIEILRNLSSLFSVSVEWLLEGSVDTPQIQIIETGSKTEMPIVNNKGMSPLQVATMDALEQCIRQKLVSNARCIELLSELQKLLDSSMRSNTDATAPAAAG